MAIELSEDDKLWCKQNGVDPDQFQKVAQLFEGEDERKRRWKEIFTHGSNGNDNGEAAKIEKPEIEAEAPNIPNKDYAEFVISMARRTVKQENSLVRQIFYTALSKDTVEPLNLGIHAPTSEGKTWPTIETLKFFPEEEVQYIGKMSTMTLVRQRGILVDSKGRPVANKVRQLRRQIRKLKTKTKINEADEKQLEELENHLNALLEDARTEINLKGKILAFLEPPKPELWDLVKPILSHDKEEIEYPFVETNPIEGIVTKKVVVKGWPACIFCTAKDESNWPSWPEIVSRFLITSPNMIQKKYEESNSLTAQRKSLPSFIQEQVIISDSEIELAKKCVRYLIRQLQTNKNQLWIPYGEILGDALKAERGTDSRAAKRIFSFLNVIPLVKADLRPKLTIKEQVTMTVATLEDLNEALSITQNYDGIPTNKMDFFKYDLYRLYKNGDAQENGVNTKEMAEAYKLRTRRSLNSDSIRKSFLYELMNNGYIEEEESNVDRRRKIYRPLVEPELEGEKIQKLRESTHSHNLLQPSVIILPKNCNNVQDNWLVLEILGFLKYGIGLKSGWTNDRIRIEDMAFYGTNGSRQTVTQFVTEYEYTYSLILYFRKADFSKFHTTLFQMSRPITVS